MKLDQAQVQAIVSLRSDPNFRIFLEALANHGETIVFKLIYAKSDKDVIQGRAQEITELLNDIAEAPGTLEKMHQPKT